MTQKQVNPWLIAFAVMFATFMEVLDTTVVNVSLPHIAGNLSASIDESTWVLTSYLVANAIILPLTGWMARFFGRKRLLMFSLIVMGLATVLIGLLPTYAQIGVWAPIGLIVLRLVQGFAVGGEWGGAVLMAAEHGDGARRGFWASWPQAGVAAGSLLSAGVLAMMANFQTEADFIAWGWRVPFLASALLVAVGIRQAGNIELKDDLARFTKSKIKFAVAGRSEIEAKIDQVYRADGEMLELTFIHKLSGEQIAEQLGITPDNVYKRRERALKKLEEILRDHRP